MGLYDRLHSVLSTRSMRGTSLWPAELTSFDDLNSSLTYRSIQAAILVANLLTHDVVTDLSDTSESNPNKSK